MKETHHRVNAEDSPDVDTSIDVATTVKRIKDYTVLSPVLLLNDDGIVKLLRDQDCGLSRRPQGVDHDVVSQDIELFLLLALDVGLASKADTEDDIRGVSADGVKWHTG